jgi:hypothetical protein
MSKTVAVGEPFVFEGIACTVAEVGGKSGKLLTVKPNEPNPLFDTRSFVLSEIAWNDAFKVWCHPARLMPRKAPGAAPLVAATKEG